MQPDCLEILSVDLLTEQKRYISEMQHLSQELSVELGWHYLLDLSWIASRIPLKPGMQVMDAGAGFGILQWWLSDHQADVTSVDIVDRRKLGTQFRNQYPIKGLRSEDELTPLGLRAFLPSRAPKQWQHYPQKLMSSLRYAFSPPKTQHAKGTIKLYHQDLASLQDIPSNSMDAIVSVSALEHNQPEKLRACVDEIIDKLKPGGQMFVTMVAAHETDWFHEPSNGWCLSEPTLRDIFDLPAAITSNFADYTYHLDALSQSEELRNNLAEFYFRSGNNGMPWGEWNPQYVPVGIVKTKH